MRCSLFAQLAGSLSVLLSLLSVEGATSDCSDDSSWSSSWGKCSSYEDGRPNHPYCPSDYGTDGMAASEACRKACGKCDETYQGGCVDDPSWKSKWGYCKDYHSNNLNHYYCDKDIGTDGKYAAEACPKSCETCAPAYSAAIPDGGVFLVAGANPFGPCEGPSLLDPDSLSEYDQCSSGYSLSLVQNGLEETELGSWEYFCNFNSFDNGDTGTVSSTYLCLEVFTTAYGTFYVYDEWTENDELEFDGTPTGRFVITANFGDILPDRGTGVFQGVGGSLLFAGSNAEVDSDNNYVVDNLYFVIQFHQTSH